MTRRTIFLVTVALMMSVTMMALSGVALAQSGDVCVRVKGETKVDRGESTCGSSNTSHAVAFNDSKETATNDSIASASGDGKARATNDSFAIAQADSKATATNNSFAEAFDCTATAHNGEGETCP
jgi:hypothetical protein